MLWAKYRSVISAAWDIPHLGSLGVVSTPVFTIRLYRPWWTIHSKHDYHDYLTGALQYPVLFQDLCDLMKEPPWFHSAPIWNNVMHKMAVMQSVIAYSPRVDRYIKLCSEASLWSRGEEETFLYRLLPPLHSAFSQVCVAAVRELAWFMLELLNRDTPVSLENFFILGPGEQSPRALVWN